MGKSDDSSDFESGMKRPSARRARVRDGRASHDTQPQHAEGSGANTPDKAVKRVHVRRPVAGSERDTELGPASESHAEPRSASESHAERGEGPRADPPARTTRSSAPRVRAARSSSVPPVPAASRVSPEPQSPAFTLEVAARAAEEGRVAAVNVEHAELEHAAMGAERARSARAAATDAELVGADAPTREELPKPAAHAIWHGDEVGPSLARDSDDPLAVHAPEGTYSADDFGLDHEYEAMLRPWLERMCRSYLHVEVQGAHSVPAHGRALLVANHSRSPLWDGIILRTALRMHHEARRAARWLVDDQQFHAPFLGTFVNRLGAVRACQDNAERLLWREELVTVFPEGAKAADRSYADRYRLQRFGRGGYVKLALRTGTPVIPVAIVACESNTETWQGRLRGATRWLGAPFRALGPGPSPLGLSYMAMPPWVGHIRISIGEPVREIACQDALATRDDGLVHELNERVRGAVQQLVNAALHT